MVGEIEFTGGLKKWGLKYLNAKHWRFAGMCDKNELESEALVIFYRTKKNFIKLVTGEKEAGPYCIVNNEENQGHFFRIFQKGLRCRVMSQSKRCFPNPYNFSEDARTGRCASLTEVETGGDVLERLVPAVSSSSSDVEDCLDLLRRMPDELKDATAALLREALGLAYLPTKTLLECGRKVTEPLNQALCRLYGFKKGRDVYQEICDAARGVAMSLESKVLSAANVKRSAGEDEQAFLKRVVEALDDLTDDKYKELPEEVQAWHDEAVQACNDDNDIPSLTEEDDVQEDDELEDVLTDDEDELEDEDEEAVEAKPKGGKGKGKGKGDRGGTKGGKDKPKGGVKASEANGESKPRGIRPRKDIGDDMVITIKAGANPRKPGSAVYEQFERYKDGMTVAKFYKAGGQRGHLVRDIRRGFVEVSAPQS